MPEIAEQAAYYGDGFFVNNFFMTMSYIQPFVELYRQRYEYHGYGRADEAICVRRNSQDARREYAPYFYTAPPNAGSDLETASRTTGLTVGSPAEVIEKVLSFPSYFGNYRRQHFGLDFGGIPERTVHEQIDLIGSEILPVLLRELGSAAQAEPDAGTRHCSRAPRNTTTQASA